MASMDALQKALPVIIFLIWVFSAGLRQNKRKQPSVSPKQPRSPAQPKPGASIFEELRRSLQTVLEEVEPPASPPEMQPSSPVMTDDFRRSDATLEVNTADESLPRGTRQGIARTSTVPAVVSPAAAVPKSGGKFTADNIGDGVLWAEILSPPLSLREHR